MAHRTHTAGLSRRPLALLAAGIITLSGMTVTTAPADAIPTPPIEFALDVRACPEQGSTPAHVYVWPSVTTVEDDLDLQEVRVRFRVQGTNNWETWDDVFFSKFEPVRFDGVDSTDVIEVEYDVWATDDGGYQSGEVGFAPLTPLHLDIPSSLALASLGSGTAGDPYRISTPQHLDDMGCLISSGSPHFVLENDLHMTDDGTPSGIPVPFLPLGGAEPSSATLDGRGHAMHGLVIDRPLNMRVGLFSNATGLVVRDLRILAPQVTGGSRVGVLGGDLSGASVSRLTIDDAVVRFPALSQESSRLVGGVAGYVQTSYFSDVRWSADVRPLPPVWPIDPDSRAQPDIRMNKIGGFAGETERATRIQRAQGTVAIALEGYQVNNVGGFAGQADEHSDFDDVTLDSAITVKASSITDIAGAFGSEFEVGVTLRDATVRTDIVLEGLPGATVLVRNVGGVAAKAEHAAFRRVDVSGTLVVDATTADGGELFNIGGFAGQAKPSGREATTVTEVRSAVDVTVRAGRTDVSNIGALYGRAGSAPGTTQDVLVTGSVVIERDRDTPAEIARVGGLVGEFDDSGSLTYAQLSRVIWRGGLTIDDLSGHELLAAIDGMTLTDVTDVGALLGTDSGVGGQRSHCVVWDVANGFTDPDPLVPGSPRTAAQLVALLDGDCGFTTGFVQDSGAPAAWCLDDDGAPAITALTAECLTSVTVTVPGEPIEALRFACAPLEAQPGDAVTCFATGVTPGAELPWSASASPAFASGTVTGNTLGGLAFTFLIPTGATTGPISVQLGTGTDLVQIDVVDPLPTSGGSTDSGGTGADSTSSGDTDDTIGGPVPSSIPAGEGRGPAPLLLAGLLALAGVAGIAAIRHLRAGGTSPTTA